MTARQLRVAERRASYEAKRLRKARAQLIAMLEVRVYGGALVSDGEGIYAWALTS